MQAFAIFNALLTAATGVTALVGDRIYPLELPQGTQPAAIVMDLESDRSLETINANANYNLRSAMVVLHLIARDLTDLAALASAVEAACNYQRGTVAGLSVVTVAPGELGAPDVESSIPLSYLPIRFQLTYRR